MEIKHWDIEDIRKDFERFEEWCFVAACVGDEWDRIQEFAKLGFAIRQLLEAGSAVTIRKLGDSVIVISDVGGTVCSTASELEFAVANVYNKVFEQ